MLPLRVIQIEPHRTLQQNAVKLYRRQTSLPTGRASEPNLAILSPTFRIVARCEILQPIQELNIAARFTGVAAWTLRMWRARCGKM